MLKLTSTFPSLMTIDGESVTIDIKRFETREEAAEFLYMFDKFGRDAQEASSSLDDQYAREKADGPFVCNAIRKYISLKQGQLEDDGQPVTTGDDLLRAFVSRQWVLAEMFARIKMENISSKEERVFRAAYLAPFVATPPEVIDAMLDAAGIVEVNDGIDAQNRKTVIDVGCGAGDLLIAAAKRGWNAIGYELHQGRAKEALQAAAVAGVSGLVHVHRMDAMTAPAEAWRQAQAVLMYLLPEPHKTIGTKLKTALLPGARVVCHAYPLGEDWPQNGSTRYVPQPTIEVDNMTPEQPKRIDASVGWVYSYEVP